MVSMRIMLAIGLMFTLLPGQEERLTFEVASIKPTKPGGKGGGMRVMPGGQEFVSQGMSLKFMIAFMYWVQMRQVTGGPAWIDNDQWDIAAKADHPRDLDDLREMFSQYADRRVPVETAQGRQGRSGVCSDGG
jgi:hypothetical protein